VKVALAGSMAAHTRPLRLSSLRLGISATVDERPSRCRPAARASRPPAFRPEAAGRQRRQLPGSGFHEGGNLLELKAIEGESGSGCSPRLRRPCEIRWPAWQFWLMPLMHSEDLAVQEAAQALFERFREPRTADFGCRHRDGIACFGRFPHRNAALGWIGT
jgi:hypothetical protein